MQLKNNFYTSGVSRIFLLWKILMNNEVFVFEVHANNQKNVSVNMAMINKKGSRQSIFMCLYPN